MKENCNYNLISLESSKGVSWATLVDTVGVSLSVDLAKRRYDRLSLHAIVDGSGLPLWPATRFLVYTAVKSKGITADTTRTYGESIVSWLKYLGSQSEPILIFQAEEETLQLFRVELTNERRRNGNVTATATVNVRIAAVRQFYVWCQRNGFESPLGEFLVSAVGKTALLSIKVMQRHPRILSKEEISRFFRFVENPYRLAYRWAIVTGMRRVEICSLLVSDLPNPEEIQFNEDGLVKIKIKRKGGKETTVYVPISLIEETHWYILTERIAPTEREHSRFVFLNRQGRPLTRWSLSSKFRQAADSIGSSATLHHLRHTYAINVLKVLEKTGNYSSDESSNPLKTLQLLLGHSNSSTTQIYLKAMSVTAPAVVEALDFLYGASL